MVTIDELRAFLRYEPDTGLFFRLHSIQKRWMLQPAGYLTDKGYIAINIKGKSYLAHRLAWLYMYEEWPHEIDHINRVRTDNSIKNLRLASRAENNRNRLHKKSTIGVRGVYVPSDCQAFRATIYVHGKRRNLGYFKTSDEAAHAYNKAAIELHGEFAVLNPIGKDYA